MIARAVRTFAVFSALTALLSACAAPQGQAPQPQAEIRAPPVARPRAVPESSETIAPPPLGTEETAIRAEYGPPDFVRNEIESQLWRYDGVDCALFVFLYREMDIYVLRHLETNPMGEDGDVDAECLSNIKRARAPAS